MGTQNRVGIVVLPTRQAGPVLGPRIEARQGPGLCGRVGHRLTIAAGVSPRTLPATVLGLRAWRPEPCATVAGTLGLFDGLLGFLSHDVGIDLGTANTLVIVRHRGIVISEPSVVAMDTRSKRVLAIGAEAKRMVGRTPANIVAIRPLRDGVISDFDVTEQMIRYFIKKVHDRYARIPRPRVLVGIPSGVTEVEKRAVRDATMNAGARWARLIEEPMAAAIGAGLPVAEPSGSLIVDIGGGTTEVAVISLGGIVVSRSIRIGGDEMDVDIVGFARREYNLLMGERTAEEIKIAVGSAYPNANDRTVTFRGRDLLTGLPRSIEVGSDQIREALEPSVAQIIEAIKETIEETPPELVADIMDQGIVLAGGGALLAGLDKRVAEATQMPVHIADDPLTCVVRGTGRVLEDLDSLERVLVGRCSAAARIAERTPGCGSRRSRFSRSSCCSHRARSSRLRSSR